jgi:endonuclease/exonuclease/phosphatase family metal-dependent hydrolase
MLLRRFFRLFLVLVPVLLSAQSVRIASYNVAGLGEREKDYATLARIIANFDVVAAEEVRGGAGVEKVLSELADGWMAAVSDKEAQGEKHKESFGFFYNDRVELYRMLGPYTGDGSFVRPPYGANFKVKGSSLVFNLVACHIDSDLGPRARAAEIDRLGDVYKYFEKLTGNRGMTIMAGDFGEERMRAFRSLTALSAQQVLPAKATTMGAGGPYRAEDHIFVSPALRPMIEKADVLYWTRDWSASRRSVSDHFPIYLVLKAGR